MSERHERCENCRFWDYGIRFILPSSDGEYSSWCHRYPPQITDTPHDQASPLTFADDWCGEWKPKEGAVTLPVVKESAGQSNPPPTPNQSTPIWELVIADMQARDKLGRERYGTPLQANNGRDALHDAYEESLDQCAYLKQAIVERNQQKGGE